MEQWMKISLLLCLFGFLKEMRPSEPFYYEFIIGHLEDVTEDQILKEAYPLGTYSNLVCLVILFLITDICRYKPLIILLGLSGIVLWSLLLWTYDFVGLMVMETMYGLFHALDVAYYSYMYAKVDKEHYQKVTSHTRGATKLHILSKIDNPSVYFSRFQPSNSLKDTKYAQNNFKYKRYFSAVGAATIWALFLPPVSKSLYFHSEDSKKQPFSKKTKSAFKLMNTHFINAFTNMDVLKWSVWWALSTCGYVQVEAYLQPLYSAIQEDDTNIYNGAVEAIITLLGFLAALLAGYLKFNWEIKGELTLGLFSLIQGALMVVVSQTEYLFLCYVFYIVFGILYHFMITIASAEIAKRIDEDSYGLIFGINMFVSLVFNSILTAVVATEGIGFALDPRGQYVVYGGYHLAISLVFMGMGIRTCVVGRKTRTVASGDREKRRSIVPS
ncbi:hypothetical protein Zmor_018514 [Zophobas morio]|uniref:Thiamine transporter 2 n=1 Tax=Zophobas morio TaxID=2755281 RepID=A0AA38IAC7_9CUCU|nr:hypothetical protein Zmor_018514 [Zophobas morio]